MKHYPSSQSITGVLKFILITYFILFILAIASSYQHSIGKIIYAQLKSRIAVTNLHRNRSFWQRGQSPKTLISHCQTAVYAKTKFAIVSLLTVDASHYYTQSAIKLAKSVRWWFPPEHMDLVMMSVISDVDPVILRNGWKNCRVPMIEYAKNTNLSAYNRFFNAKLYSKLNAWAIAEAYEAVLFLDLDTLMIRDASPLFTHHIPAMQKAGHSLGAVLDSPASLRNNFNSGVMLLTVRSDNWNGNRSAPSAFEILTASIAHIEYDENYADQGFLNAFYREKNFYKLPFIYNANVVSKLLETETVWLPNENTISILHYTVSKGWESFRHFILWPPYSSFICWYWNTDDLCWLWDQI